MIWSVLKFDVVYPESVAHGAGESFLQGGCDHHHGVSGLCVGRSPAVFVDGDDFAPAVFGIIGEPFRP